jgi:hypothetical protein
MIQSMKTRTTKKTSAGDDKVRKNYRLMRSTHERLERAKRQLNISETSAIEAALRLWFRQEGVE